MKLREIVLGLCAIFVAVACAPRFSTPLRTEVPDQPDRVGSGTGQFWIIADSQLNNVAGNREQSELHDALENVAIRPVSLDLWSELVLRFVIGKIAAENTVRRPAPIFFLGDGANTSCEDEYVRFLTAMGLERESPPWFAAIGNHDGYYMGNLGGPTVKTEWAAACSQSQPIDAALTARLVAWRTHFGAALGPNTMPKALAVLLYLDALHARGVLAEADDPLVLGNWQEDKLGYGSPVLRFRRTGSYSVSASDGTPKLAVTVDATIANTGDASDVFSAFLAQDVALPSGDHALIADTSDFVEPPPSGYKWAILVGKITGVENLPGELGMVSIAQAAILERFAAALNKIPESRFWILGHHDWQSISVPGAYHLRKSLFENKQFVTYASAHTHDPTATGGINGAHQWELNVASITDWPMEYVKVRYWTDKSSSDIAVDLHNSYASGDEKACTLSRPHPGVKTTSKTATSEEHDNAAELAYAGERYALHGLDLYERLLKRLQLAPAQYPEIYARMSDADLSELVRLIDAELAQEPTCHGPSTSPSAADTRRKSLLLRLQTLDRTVFELSAQVATQERQCAVWASHIEQIDWAGSRVGLYVRKAKRPRAEKAVIDGGVQIKKSLVYRIVPGDLPVCPDTAQVGGGTHHCWASNVYTHADADGQK